MKRINWGWRIVILYGGFVAFMLFLVFKTTTVNTDLVTPDYYSKELKYQEQLEKEKRANGLATKLSWAVNPTDLLIKFPGDLGGKKISANVLFYCPSDKANDFAIKCEPDNNNECRINTEKMKKGVYQLQIDWNADDLSYYNEGTINVN